MLVKLSWVWTESWCQTYFINRFYILLISVCSYCKTRNVKLWSSPPFSPLPWFRSHAAVLSSNPVYCFHLRAVCLLNHSCLESLCFCRGSAWCFSYTNLTASHYLKKSPALSLDLAPVLVSPFLMLAQGPQLAGNIFFSRLVFGQCSFLEGQMNARISSRELLGMQSGMVLDHLSGSRQSG